MNYLRNVSFRFQVFVLFSVTLLLLMNWTPWRSDHTLCDRSPGNATQARSTAHTSSTTASGPRTHGRNERRQLLGVMFQEEL